ncbi:hypothetical protein CKAH01_03088 [Colletotrichum kahawae]|uniref:BTB domain-containing protein n=1 Tax=Colletotrichum kahawae TaxID=34407 RepID=A0AAD9YV60_COLKA|nr:hypothetical protein CKAH01_03088 [Colletotrichum kahawae]
MVMEINCSSVTNVDANNDDKPAPLGLAAMDLSWAFCSLEEKSLVTIKCGSNGDEKTFMAFKPILTRHSLFFKKCLGNPCKESISSTVELPEVSPGGMMLYLTLATRQALMNRKFMDTLVKKEDLAIPNAIESHARFYQLCDFLQNEELAKSTHKMLVDFLKSLRRINTGSNCPGTFRAFGDTFGVFEPGHVAQTSAHPGQELLSSRQRFGHPDFHFEVAKQYALNSMWNDPVQRSAAEKTKTQRMLIDDESEPEQ